VTTVELPDGREIEFPDTMSRDDMSAAVKRFLAKSSDGVGEYEPLQPEKQATPDSTVRGAITQLGTGFNRRLGSAIDTFDRYVKEPIDALGDQVVGMVTNKPVQPRRRLVNPVTALAEAVPPSQAPGEQVAARIGEEFANALPAMIPAYAWARMATAPRTAFAAPTTTQRVVDTVRTGMQNAPTAAFAGDLTATAGGGVGAGIAEQAAPGDRVAETIGQVAGSVLPTVALNSPTALAVRGARTLIEKVSPAAARTRAREQVGSVVGDELTPTARAGLQEAEALRKDIPGFEPSLAEATGSPGLVATQRAIEGRAQGMELERYAGRRDAAEGAVEGFAKARAPAGISGDAAPEFVVDTASGRAERIRGAVDRARERLDAQGRAIAEKAPMGYPAASGEVLRDAYTTLRKDAREQMGALANQLGISDSDVSAPFAIWRQSLIQELTPDTKFTRQAKDLPYLRGVLEDMARDAPNGKITFTDVKALRERVSEDILKAQRGSYPGQDQDVRQLVLVKKKVDGLIDDLAQNGTPNDPGLAERYKQFRDTYRTDYIERFDKGAAFKVRERDSRGFYRTEDEEIGKAFWAPGNVSGVRQFNRVFAGDADANQALADVALDSLHRAAVRDGRIEPKRFAEWQRQHADLLGERPDIAKLVANIADAETGVATRQATLDVRAKRIEDAMLTRLLGQVERGTKTPEQLIDAALKDPRKMDQLLAATRAKPEAQNALKRHVWDRAAYMDAGPMLDFIAQNRPTLMRVMGVPHLSNLERIQRARAMLERVPAPTGSGYEVNPLKDVESKIGMGVPQLASRIFAVESGRTSPRFVAADAFGRFYRSLKRNQAEKLLKEALYDPKVAKDLADLSRMPGQQEKGILGRLGGRLLQIGARAVADEDSPAAEPQNDQPQAFADGGRVDPFDPDSDGYDYETARRKGMAPGDDGHWGTRVELDDEEAAAAGLPSGSGVMLKGAKHPTWLLGIAGEEEAGFAVVKGRDGRYYSVPRVRAEDKSGFADGGRVPADRRAIKRAERTVNPEPTGPQIDAGNYSKGHLRLHGLDISLENPKGGTRRGTRRDGTPWEVEMPAAYGYIRRTKDRDGEQVDVYVGDNPKSERVFLVDQIDPETGRFDEHKAMLAVDDEAEATALYDASFSDGSGPTRRGAVTPLPISVFKTWLASGNTRKPVMYREPS
jgi:hypothetical protein